MKGKIIYFVFFFVLFFLNAAKLVSKDHRVFEQDVTPTTNAHAASILRGETPIPDIFSLSKEEIKAEHVGLVSSVDNLISRNNTIPSYFTLVLPK